MAKFNPNSILLIATRQMGDVLLATPLLRTLRRAYPEASIDVLVYTDKGGMLEGNRDCNAVIETDEHLDWRGLVRILRRIFRRYELAVTVQANDRGHLFAWLASRRRVGLIPDMTAASAWKRASCRAWAVLDNVHTHTVAQNLRLADLLGVPRDYSVVPPCCEHAEAIVNGLVPWPQQQGIAVLHPLPMWHYKRWTRQGWAELIAGLRDRGLKIVLTGGPADEEVAYCEALADGVDVLNLAGKLPIPALPALLGRARLFVGPDTSITHLAAACGLPTLALYGPSNPLKWGPWPAGWNLAATPYTMLARPWQRHGNVLLLQGVQPADRGVCLPCREEGCDKHKRSLSRCLSEMPASLVLAAADELLAGLVDPGKMR